MHNPFCAPLAWCPADFRRFRWGVPQRLPPDENSAEAEAGEGARAPPFDAPWHVDWAACDRGLTANSACVAQDEDFQAVLSDGERESDSGGETKTE